MADGVRFRKDLFAGTAAYYDRFRPPYPEALLEDLRARVPLRPTSRVVDLACATGQIAFPLAGDVAEVWAVDQEPELVDFGRTKAERLGIGNIRWHTASAEDVELDGPFDLVAIGNAFHRLERGAVAHRLRPCLREGGCIALLWSGPPWLGDAPWQRAFDATLERWRDELDARDLVPEGWDDAIERDPHADVLRRAGFSYEGSFEFAVAHRWTVNTLAGLVYSTSFLNRTVLGERVDAFESDLRGGLLAVNPEGEFEQTITFAYEFARRST